MLPLMCGEIKQDNIRNDNIRESVGVSSIVKTKVKIDLCGLSMLIEDL